MTVREKLNKKFDTLNKKYVSISKKMDKIARTQDTSELEQQLDKIQDEMSKVANELELIATQSNRNDTMKNNIMKKSELKEMIGEIIKEVISEQAISNKITEANVPDNIKKFAKRKGVSSLVNTVAGWAEKVGKRITGGTAVGKDYSTLILDMGYQTADIYINTEEGIIELYGEPVRNFNEFNKVYLSNQESETNESVDYDTAVAYRITVPGNRDDAMASIKTLLDNLTIGKSKKFPEVKVVMLPSKGNPQDLILKLNGPGAFSMSKDIKARPELKNMKVKTYSPQLTKIS